MGVVVEDIRISNEFTGTTTNYLLGNVGDKITIEVDFRAEEIFVTENEAEVDRILLAPQNFRVNTTDTNDIIYCEDITALANFRIGDKVGIFTATSQNPISGVYNYYICYEKINDQAIRVHAVGGSPGDVDFYASNSNNYDIERATNSSVFIDTDLTSINYRWNFIENLALNSFLNKIDGQLNQAKAGGLTVGGGASSMIFDSPITNNYGSVTVEKLAGTTTAQKYTLTHETIITPFFLAGQKFDLEDGIAPDYFNSSECLKYIVSIDAGRNDNDPNFIQTVDFNALDGNNGWFGENFNGNNNNYSVGSVTYKRLDTTVIDSIELTDNAQTVEIGVISNNGTFSNNNTEFTLNFSILPDDSEDYTYNNKTIIQNFYFDRAKNTVGSAGVSGDNNGTDEQIFSDLQATFVDANNITITATIDLNSVAINDLTQKDFEYLLWVSVADYTKDTEESDRVSLIADIEPFFIDLTDDGLIDFDTKFLRHYESDTSTEGTTSLIARTEDDVLGYTQFTIDRNGRETDSISINNVTAELIAKKSDGSEFTLESYSQSFGGTFIIGDSQYIDANSERVFKMPTGEQRKTISVKRRSDLDTTDLRYYEFAYPFLFRWEYWTALAGVNGDAFDTNEPNNGFNEQWHRYDTLADWDIYYRVDLSVNKNGNNQLYRNESLIETFTYNEDSDWTTETIVALNADTLAPQGTLLVSPTRIKASKTYVGGTAPSLVDVEWVMRIEVYEQGGISDIRYLSSVYDWTENSWFKSIDTSNKVVKSLAGSIYSAEALVDFSALPANSTFKISARIYNEAALAPIPPGAKLMEDGTVKLMEDGTIKIIE